MIRFDDGFKPESGLFGQVFFFLTSGRSSAGGGGDGARRSRKRP